ncbi:unnamed protein product [Trichobilharzia regenti]|nr:unnamed protein product [Trichobilharzia regenti]
MRVWTAFYCAIFGFLFVGCNMSGIANHIRRSVEEVYNSFIGFFFLLKALFTMFLIRKLLGALNVPLGMLLITGLERIFFRGYNLPTVNIPPSNQVNASTWVNSPDFSRLLDYSKAPSTLIHGTSAALGIALAIIIFTEAALNG